MANRWMIYGANGYTAGLVARLARNRGHQPILAGRKKEAIEPIAVKLDIPFRIFDLNDQKQLSDSLADIDLVAHLAGPFVHTFAPMVKACLATGTHYMDITGEYNVFEAIHAKNDEAKKAGVILIPGVGFDVVPTDCLAAMLAQQLPDATELELALSGFGGGGKGFSRGTLKTMVGSMHYGSAARIDGKITPVSTTWRTPTIDFPHKKQQCITMPWGDISTAYHSTGIPNIAVYFAGKPDRMRRLDLLRPLFRPAFVRKGIQWLIQNRIYGPDDKQRARSRSVFWGRVKNEKSETVVGTMESPEGYTLTADSTVKAVERVLTGKIKPGVYTPSAAFGDSFVKELEGVSVHPFKKSTH